MHSISRTICVSYLTLCLRATAGNSTIRIQDARPPPEVPASTFSATFIPSAELRYEKAMKTQIASRAPQLATDQGLIR